LRIAIFSVFNSKLIIAIIYNQAVSMPDTVLVSPIFITSIDVKDLSYLLFILQPIKDIYEYHDSDKP